MILAITGHKSMPKEYFMKALLANPKAKKLMAEATEIVTGGYLGADSYVKEMYDNEFDETKFTEFKADYATFGAYAAGTRNKKIAEYSDAVIVVMWHQNFGNENCLNMVQAAKAAGKKLVSTTVKRKNEDQDWGQFKHI